MHCVEDVGSACIHSIMLEVARSRRPPLPEIVLWIAASRSPSESQTSECSDLLSRSRATFVIVAQRQPGKLHPLIATQSSKSPLEWTSGGSAIWIPTSPHRAPLVFLQFPDQGASRNKVESPKAIVMRVRKPSHQFWFRTFM